MVIFMKENNNNNNNNTGLDVNRIIKMKNKDDNKSGFFGTIDNFKELARQIKPILNKSLNELFGIGKTYEIGNNTFLELNVRYKSKNINNTAFEATKETPNEYVIVDEQGSCRHVKGAIVAKVDIFSTVVFDENIEKSIEECEKYNKLMWKKYSNKIIEKDENNEVYKKYRKDFDDLEYTVQNFKYQCEFYNKLIDKFIDEYHLKPPERKRVATIFFYILNFFIYLWYLLLFYLVFVFFLPVY